MLKHNIERYNIDDSDFHILEEGIGFGARKPKNNPKKKFTTKKSKIQNCPTHNVYTNQSIRQKNLG